MLQVVFQVMLQVVFQVVLQVVNQVVLQVVFQVMLQVLFDEEEESRRWCSLDSSSHKVTYSPRWTSQ